jgi:hypothetical protein
VKAVASAPRHPFFIVVTLSVASDGIAAESAITRRFHRARHAHIVLQSGSHVRCAIRTSTSCHTQFSVALLQAFQQFSILGAVKSVALHILLNCCSQLPQWLCSTCTVEPLFNQHVQTIQIYADRFCAMFDRAHSGSVILIALATCFSLGVKRAPKTTLEVGEDKSLFRTGRSQVEVQPPLQRCARSIRADDGRC